MHLQEKVTAHMDLVAIFCIAIRISMSNQVRCWNLGWSYTRPVRKREADF